MKIKIDLGDELKHAKILSRNKTPVTINFDKKNVIGWADVNSDGVADIQITDVDKFSSLINSLECGFGGRILERKGNVITKLHIDELSLQIKQDE